MNPEIIKRTVTLVIIVAAAVIGLVAPILFSEYIVTLLTRVIIFAIVAVSLDMLIGYTGIGHIGHAAFFAIGAYTTAIMVLRLDASFWATCVSSILIAVGISAVASLLILRARLLYQLMISLAIAMCVWGLLYRWVSLTGGENGLTGITRDNMGLPFDLTGTTNYYYFVLVIFAISFALMVLIIKSPFGKTLMGIRDGEERMRVMGYNVWFHKYLALIICSAFAGLAGCLHVYFNNFISPDASNLATCMDFVLMVIIGGPGTMVGSVMGSGIVEFLKHILSVYTARWLMILGAVYILTALYAPEGIMGIWKKHFMRKRKKFQETFDDSSS